jgi:hypothetical protein
MAESEAELLNTLIPHVRPQRKHRRATWQPGQVTGDLNPGQRGQMSPLEAREMNDAYVPDIGNAAPATRPMAEGDVAEDEAPNPFMFAAQNRGGQRQIVSQNGQMYEKVCENGECRLVLIQDSQPQLFQQNQPQLFQQKQLPPGVVEGPGESYVVGSLRESTSTASAPMATVGPPTSQPGAFAARPSERRVEDNFDRASELAQRLYGPALQAYGSMQGAASAQDAVALRLLGDAHMRVGDQVLGQLQNEDLSKQADRLEGQANEILALKDPVKRQAKDAEVITAIRSGEGSVQKRAQDVVTHRLRSMPDNIQISSDDWSTMVQEEAAVVNARDIASSLDAARALGRTIDSRGGRPTYEQQVMNWRFANEIRFRLKDRYASYTDPNQLRVAVAGELGKTYEYSIRKDLEARGVGGDELEFRSAFDTRTAIDAAVMQVRAMQQGQSPELAMPMPPKRESQAASQQPQESPSQEATAQPKSSGTGWLEALSSGPW